MEITSYFKLILLIGSALALVMATKAFATDKILDS